MGRDRVRPVELARAVVARVALPEPGKTRAAAALIRRRVDEQPELRPWYEAMTDEDARMHFGPDELIEPEHLREGLRVFHAWRVHTLRERFGDRLETAQVLDVGDTDGLLLKHLGKAGTGFNLAPAVVRNIRANGIDAVLGDGQQMPFDDASFDCVLCFETLEHVENPLSLLDELARVCKPGGRVFLSIPWVPRTQVQPRDFSIDRGYGHIIEFAPREFRALITHSALEISWATTCDILGRPRTYAERALLAVSAGSPVVHGTFRRFQFYELAHRESGVGKVTTDFVASTAAA